MKKYIFGILSTWFTLVCAASFSACNIPHQHSYVDKVTNPTCIEQGYTTHTCDCGDTKIDTYVNAKGHSYTNYVSNDDATCIEDGTKTAFCDNDCGEQDTIIDLNSKLGHDEKIHQAKEPTCLESGWNEYVTCERDGCDYSTYENIPLGAHTYQNGNCSVCQETSPELFTFTLLSDNTYEIKANSKNNMPEKVTIPASYNGKAVTSIGYQAFNNYGSLQEIVFPNSIVTIGSRAFYNCSALSNIVIPDSVTSIESYAFYSCVQATSITIGKGVTSIGDYAFYGLNLVTDLDYNAIKCSNFGATNYIFSSLGLNTDGVAVTIGKDVKQIPKYFLCPYYSSSQTVYLSKVTSITFEEESQCQTIGENAFRGLKGLTELVIPNSVTQIAGEESFSQGILADCTKLKKLTIPFVGSNKLATGYESVFGFLFDYETEDSASNISGGTYQIQDKSASGSSTYSYVHYFIPASLKEVTITGDSIPNRAFYNCSTLTSITLNSDTISIGQYSFYNCDGLLNFTIPDSVKGIGYSAFRGCDNLENISIPNSVTTLDSYAFYDCLALASVSLGEGLTILPSYAFCNCSALEEIIIPSSIETIGTYAFSQCTTLSSVSIEDGVSSIESYAFNGCSDLVILAVPDTLISIGSYAFQQCTQLYSLTLKEGLKTIGSRAFYNCSSLSNIVIPDSVTSIESYAFYSCVQATSITIGKGVTSIGDYAFYGLNLVTDLDYNAITCSNFGATNYIFSSLGLNTDGVAVTIGKDVKQIPKYFLCPYYSSSQTVYLSKVTSITFEEESQCKTIGENAFRGLKGLTELVIPNSVTQIAGEESFSPGILADCTKLKKLTIPFVGSNKLATGYESVFGFLFDYETEDSASNISGGTYQIQDKSASGSSTYSYVHYFIPASLKEVTITGDSIPNRAFYNCSMLTSITLNSDTISIGQYSFYNCDGLLNFTIPDSVKGIGYSAFRGCDNLENISIPNSVTTLDSYAFYDCANLKTATIGSGVTVLPAKLFSQCVNLQTINLSAGISAISSSAFESTAYQNTEDNWENEVLYIGEYLIAAKTSISGQYIIKDGTVCIAEYAFSGCSNLQSIVIPLSVTIVNANAFRSCSITAVYYCGVSENWIAINFAESNTVLTNATRYYYSESEPELNAAGTAYKGKNWHYVNGLPTIWVYSK